MYWSADPHHALDSMATSQLDLHTVASAKEPAPRMHKVLAARQAVIYQDFDVEELLDQIINSVTSDLLASKGRR